MEKIGLPKVTEQIIGDNHSKFVIEPLYPGYGPTLGNSLRRVLLSSIIGSAATSFKIDGVSHEFAAISHVKEDVVELMMNLKDLNIKSFSDEPVTIEISKKGPGEVTAADFKANSNVEICNPELHIVSLDNKADFNLEVVIEKDRGFRASATAGKERAEIGRINVDASFSPVERVILTNEDTRVGQTTNFDKLSLEIITNGTISPSDALKQASQLLVDHFSAIISDENYNEDLTETFAQKKAMDEANTENNELDEDMEEEIDGKTSIEDANFSQRTTNALVNAGIKTISGLKKLSPLKLEEIKGLGKKGIEEIKEKINK